MTSYLIPKFLTTNFIVIDEIINDTQMFYLPTFTSLSERVGSKQ